MTTATNKIVCNVIFINGKPVVLFPAAKAVKAVAPKAKAKPKKAKAVYKAKRKPAHAKSKTYAPNFWRGVNVARFMSSNVGLGGKGLN